MKNKIVKLLVVLVMAVLTFTIGVKAAKLISASKIVYNDTTVEETLDKLIEIAIQCPDNALCSKAKVGDYISMTPTQTSYTIPGKTTGYINTTTGKYIDQTINPSELNLWRVISINLDGTIDMVSEYVSSANVNFYGQEGYMNSVGALNNIANQYGNNKYTIRTRHMGYNGQTATITNTSKFTKKIPYEESTSDNNNEIYGGGDVMYSNDIDLVRNALGTLKANKVGTTTPQYYWLASRGYEFQTKNMFIWGTRYVHIHADNVDTSMIYYGLDGELFPYKYENAIRPIVTLKSTIDTFTGTGTSDDPWILN